MVSGIGIATPLLLILHGVAYSFVQNSSWYREQMIPFMLRIITTTEIETDRYLQYHRRTARYLLVLGWIAILLCQFVWTFGLTHIIPFFVGDDFILRFVGVLVGYVVFFGPFLLYFLILLLIAWILEEFFLPRYNDIEHLFDIENRWAKENKRRSIDQTSVPNKLA